LKSGWTNALVIVEDNRVAVFDDGARRTAVVADDGWGDELIAGEVRLGGMIVIVLDGRLGGGEFRPLAEDDGAIGFFHALPAVVAVHGPVSAADGGDLADAEFAHFPLNLPDISQSAVGGGIAPIGESVKENAIEPAPAA
jgi:hypothetical protein